MRHAALTILILLAFATAAWGMGSREDPLVQADKLIASQRYDEAILYLTDFIKQYPDRFDAAQQRLKRINRIRTAYNQTAVDLIGVIKDDPTNQAKKLAMIRELENLESNPNPTVKEFVVQTKALALFTYNQAKFEEIMAGGRALIDGRKFVEAAKLYQTGFVLYAPEFSTAGLDPVIVSAAFGGVEKVSEQISIFSIRSTAVEQAFSALALAYRGGSEETIAPAWSTAREAAVALAETRRTIVDQGRTLEATFASISASDKTITDSSFLPFAFRFVLGRKTEGKLEGVSGAVDAAWVGALGSAQVALDETLSTGMESAGATFDSGDWAAAGTAFETAARTADHGIALTSLWSHYIPSDLVERSTALGQAALQLKGADYLRYVHAGRTARSYATLASINVTIDRDAAALAAYVPSPDAKTESLAAYETSRLAFAESARSVEAIRVESGGLATRMAAWTQVGFGSESSQAEQGALDGRIANTTDRTRSLETLAVATAASYEYSLVSAEAQRAIADAEAGKKLLDGLPSDDPLLPDATFRYPGKALASLASADSTLKTLRANIDAMLASIASRPGYIASDASVLAWAERARALAAEAAKLVSETVAVTAKAREQKQLADSSRLEAERRVAESRTALRANNFETARERLERARERYLATLSFEQDPLLRAESDKLLSELSATILKTENDLVVAETRRLVTSGRNFYLQGEFDSAESTLLQARSRWKTTNSTPEVEVEYWLKLVQTALSVKTGRDIPVTAPLFPEMSQILSLAKRYYEEGSALLARRDKTGAVKSFTEARKKISEVKVVFPLNQEARVLELKIDQLSDPDAFGTKFARMFSEARAKIDAKADLTTAYSDLKDLEAINPRYPGLRTQIERAEILLGFRQPPPDPKAIAEARSLVLAARRIFDSGQVAQFAFARTQLEKAIGLDPNNEAASQLKDRLATYIGGDTAIVLSSAAETLYGEAVTFFTRGDYINARARLTRILAVFPRGGSIQKVADLDSRLTAIGY
jgi:hypothetical protein